MLVKGVVVDVVVVFNVSIDVVFVLDFGFADDVIDEIGDVVVFDIVSDVRWVVIWDDVDDNVKDVAFNVRLLVTAEIGNMC